MDINRSTKMGKYRTWYAKLSIVSKCRDVMHSNNHVQIWFPNIFTWVWLQWSKRTTKWHSKPLKGRYHHIFSKKTIMHWVSAGEEHTNDTGKWLTFEIEWVNEPLEFVMSCCVSLLLKSGSLGVSNYFPAFTFEFYQWQPTILNSSQRLLNGYCLILKKALLSKKDKI